MKKTCVSLCMFLVVVFASPALSRAEHDGKLQVLLLGDSTSIGSVCRITDPKGPHLEDVIRLQLATEKDLPPVNVINQGRDGEYIQGLLASKRYDKEIATLPGIDYVLIRYGLNDIGRREDFDNNFPKDFHELIARLKADFPKAAIIPVTIIPYMSAEADARVNKLIAKVAEEEKLPLFDVYTRYQAELKHGPNMLNYRRYPLAKIPEAQREWVKPFVKNDSVVVMDNRLDAHFRDLSGWFGDRHPNLAGYHVIGDETAKFLATQIRQKTKASPKGIRFDLEALFQPPAVFPADVAPAEGVKALYYEGVKYKGKPTRVFAYYGVPQASTAESGKKFPAMVLIHGGGGTAFDRWVKVWNSRGYAAIAMDLCGCVPVREGNQWQHHEHGGPRGWDASFSQLDDPVEDQWTYQAVSAVALAHSLLRSYPEVDAQRIGVTGISWGGYMTSIVAGVDSRFKFAVPVYGCGFLGENSAWLPAFDKMGQEKAGLWLRQWDPSNYLKEAKMPILWVNGTNDFAYPMDSWQKSYRLPATPRTLCLRIRMPHGHGPVGENPEEIHAFANQFLAGGKPLAIITEQGQKGDEAWATFKTEVPVTKAELAFTTDEGKWQDRKWESAPAEIDAKASRVTAKIPAGAKVFYLNLFDERDCAVSTEHIEVQNSK
jgi:lysophospholipase L1-like esterase/dienelactone hydrolase